MFTERPPLMYQRRLLTYYFFHSNFSSLQNSVQLLPLPSFSILSLALSSFSSLLSNSIQYLIFFHSPVYLPSKALDPFPSVLDCLHEAAPMFSGSFVRKKGADWQEDEQCSPSTRCHGDRRGSSCQRHPQRQFITTLFQFNFIRCIFILKIYGVFPIFDLNV